MAEYFSGSVKDFLMESDEVIQAKLHTSYASDGFSSQYTSATKAWGATLTFLRPHLQNLIKDIPEAEGWGLILEYPLYRLRIRLDLIILSFNAIYVIELKTGSTEYLSADKRQVEEYALDLRDFHSGSFFNRIHPILWCPERNDEADDVNFNITDSVSSVVAVGKNNLIPVIKRLELNISANNSKRLSLNDWLSSEYKPVPSIISAATAIFGNHGVKEISNADADNLAISGQEITNLIEQAKRLGEHYLIFLSGVPGSGKTLAGLQVVHDVLNKKILSAGEIVYLSGNTPLVVVLREALALDQVNQSQKDGQKKSLTLKRARMNMRVTIQHVMDFLNQYLKKEIVKPPIDHVIVFDEAQRAWDEKQGKAKFDRQASEPELVLGVMERHSDWAVVVALIGVGQEINDGEHGLSGWGSALMSRLNGGYRDWKIFGSEISISGLNIASEISSSTNTFLKQNLHLTVSQRSYRAPQLTDWVNSVITGDSSRAKKIKLSLSNYPVVITRDRDQMKNWLINQARGQRRIGLLASSGAKRLRADGYGEFLHANDGVSIAHWYLKTQGDLRSSFALEVPANEYTSQGLEIDYVGLCWGGDLIRLKKGDGKWGIRKLGGTRWSTVKVDSGQRFVENSYRVLMTRAREGMVIWVPYGAEDDETRSPEELDLIYSYLIDCGVEVI